MFNVKRSNFGLSKNMIANPYLTSLYVLILTPSPVGIA